MKHQQQQNILQSLELDADAHLPIIYRSSHHPHHGHGGHLNLPKPCLKKDRSQLHHQAMRPSLPHPPSPKKAPVFKKKKNDLTTTRVALVLLRFNVALQIAVLAMAINIGLAIGAFYHGQNALYCAFGIDCIIGVITAAILIWRFASQKTDHLKEEPNVYLLNGLTNAEDHHHRGSSTTTNWKTSSNMKSLNKYNDLMDSMTIDPEDARDHARELWSTFWLGQVMIISGIVVVIRTVIELASHIVMAYLASKDAENVEDFGWDTPSSMEPLFVLAFISLCLNLLLMLLKMAIYIFLDSNSMLIEGINSFISAIFALVAMISIRYSASVQYLDQVVSILFGLFLFVYGGYNVITTAGQTLYTIVQKTTNSSNDRLQYERLV